MREIRYIIIGKNGKGNVTNPETPPFTEKIMKRKRQFEIISSIIGIILGAFIALSGLLAAAAPDTLLEFVDPRLLQELGMS